MLLEITRYASHRALLGPGWLFVETAGGVHSPGPSGSTQADLYRQLRLPVILVGDSKLGGISQTISSFESLKIRGYDVELVCLFKEDSYQNYVYLTQYFAQRGVQVRTFSEPPARVNDSQEDVKSMKQYYEHVCQLPEVASITDLLAASHQRRISRLESMRAIARETIWYPFTQHTQLSQDKITVIDSAKGDYFQILGGVPTAGTSGGDLLLQPAFDGSASWWTQGLGHGSPALSLAAAYAAGRYGHVMFAEAVHEPALALAETLLVGMANPRLTRVFYSDNGSTGTEVAVKMALRASRLRYGWDAGEKLEVLGLRGSYHGDTIGAMNCSEPCVFNEKVEWYEGKGYWFDYPTVRCSDGVWRVRRSEDTSGGQEDLFACLSDIFDLDARKQRGEAQVYETGIREVLLRLQSEGRRFGALLLEPVVLGAGGMLLVFVLPAT